MKLPVLPPGTILQHLYLKEKLNLFKPGHFLEVGCGKGFISKILLDLGWSGVGCDLNLDSLNYCSLLNCIPIEQGRYSVVNQDFFTLSTDCLPPKFDLVISCMVLEHLNEADEYSYFQLIKKILKPQGKIILLVPSCPDYWGCEDEIAGHFRRYTFKDIRLKLSSFGFTINDLAGLTYPVSNILYPISELLVSRAESKLKSQTMFERTKKSGNRNVFLKTNFPNILRLLLNNFTMYPFHILQKCNKKNNKSLIIYTEATLE
jgi:SAM-dependent methyltransferase